ncbi:nucleolar complex protein 4 homolog A [Glossina fuscipes]|uniref:Nucleolar complex protein 4 homolog A n=1 Tax=Glossina fuscipes TaxID=7396 RepID=A0A8U0WER6_9MUSC|nr:nucleolar complex protein 4 homolog A [Glossina fuscipes]
MAGVQNEIGDSDTIKNEISKELRDKANEFLNNKLKANNLVDIVVYLEVCLNNKQPIIPGLLTLEVVFTELLKRRDFCENKNALDGKVQTAKSEALIKYCAWLRERYEDSMALMLKAIDSEKEFESVQALSSCMKLLAAEGKYPLDGAEAQFPQLRLHNILQKLLSVDRLHLNTIQHLKDYTVNVDFVQYCWRLLQHNLLKKSTLKHETFALNFLELIHTLPVSKELFEQNKRLCPFPEKALPAYGATRKHINKVWNNLMQCVGPDMLEIVHKKLLIILLERILPHLDKPILLTDFLMDSLDCGGAVSLLALQGMFTLIQKHNITYPNVYEKLYSMFEPEIFHTKFKARLFYLADIFLSSTHLPEGLVAAFVKRLARLSIVAPPQDAVIILYFIGNLLMRHTGLKRLICAPNEVEVSRDPYVMEERQPVKANALESSLWEIVALQKHALPTVAAAAKFIMQPLPKNEWDLSSVLEIKEDDIFDQEISKRSKQYAMAIEKSQALFLPKNDLFQQNWCLI